MKFKIFNPNRKPRERTEVFFKLVASLYGGVTLIACDSTGEMLAHGNILDIRGTGKLDRRSCVNDALGLQLDARRRIKLSTER